MRSLLVVYSAALIPTLLLCAVIATQLSLSAPALLVVGLALLISLVGFPLAWSRWWQSDIGSWSQMGAWLLALSKGEQSPMPAVPDKIVPAVQAVSRSVQLQAEHISHLSLVDAQTGLLSRNGLVRRLADEHDRAVRFDRSLAVMCVSNANPAEPLTENQARLVGSQLRKYARSVDVLARMGDEDFGLLLPETSVDGAKQLAHRLISDAKQSKLPALVAGLAVFPTHSMNADRLLLSAESAAQSGLESGADSVVLYAE